MGGRIRRVEGAHAVRFIVRVRVFSDFVRSEAVDQHDGMRRMGTVGTSREVESSVSLVS